jgi:ABC-type transport system involved in cytochrome c biogenesis permease subunit
MSEQIRESTPGARFRAFIAPLASLRITVTLIAFTFVLVFAGTTAQKDLSSWDVQKEYFYAWGVMAPVKYFLPLTRWSETLPQTFNVGRWTFKLAVPLVGGATIAWAMLLNLTAAHIVRFRITWRDVLAVPPLVAVIWWAGTKTAEHGYYALTAALVGSAAPLVAAMYLLHGKRGGVHLIHLGLILVIGGELATNAVKVEQVMSIDEGGYANYASDIRYSELAIVDSSSPSENKVVTINESRLKPGLTIADPRVPFAVHVDAYYGNSQLLGPMQAKPQGLPEATAGAGTRVAVQPLAKGSGVGKSAADMPAAYVTLSKDGKELGRYLVSQQLNPQPVEVDGKTYEISLRWPRYYKPFQLHLKDFRFDRHTGTNMARNFSSDVRLVDPRRGEERDVRIWMNHPLRYNGETFFQQTFDDVTEATTVLQVVRNPSWLFPYIACVVGGLGMVAHFGVNLLAFSRKRTNALATAALTAPAVAAKGAKNRKEGYVLPPRYGPAYTAVPTVVLAMCVIYLLATLIPRSAKTPAGLDLSDAAAIPMNYEGRVLPLDTLARVSLKVITGGKEELTKVLKEADKDRDKAEREQDKANPKPKPSGMEFLFDLFTQNPRAREYKIFKIDNAEVIGLMRLRAIAKDGTERQFFSWSELEPQLMELRDQVIKSAEIDDKHKSVFHREAEELWKQAKTFDNLAALTMLYLVPPKSPGGEWRQARPLLDAERAGGPTDEALGKFRAVLQAYDTANAQGADAEASAKTFHEAVGIYRAHVAGVAPRESAKAPVEVFFNRAAPFYHLMAFYVLAFVLVMVSFLAAPLPLRRAAMWVLVLTLAVHTLGLIFRMYLQGRPPVTTLYSAAIFIGWAGVLLGLGAEMLFKNGVGLLVASVKGFASLFVAHNLSLTDGDTLRELQAVLDTNFWLATHVVLITLGYAATFLAGAAGITYVLRGVGTTSLDKAAGKDLLRMVYGIICFAMLFSFVGTVLGGIWADQSWGRFWGWDPKENGAILIVLWNALILHARWGGLVKERGVMLLAIFGNVVTAWSFFGTNELGIGLHAYGFTEGRRFWLLMFVLSQIVFIGIGAIPLAAWRSASRLRESPTR